MIVNEPEVRIALVGVSRDCFPIELTQSRLAKLSEACEGKEMDIYVCKTTIESESDVLAAIEELSDAEVNAMVLYLGNFGPEGPLSILAANFWGPIMVCGAAEESKDDLISGRGDALCGMLNASYNLKLRDVTVHIPEKPIGLPEELSLAIKHFETVAKIYLGVVNLKIFSFGPRPQDFYACNAPIKPLYELGVEVMENSELDLLMAYNAVDEDDPEVAAIAEDMATELGAGATYPDLLPKLARFELTLLRFYEQNLGSRPYAVFADKCWPAFEKAFGFVPCYVNSRLATRGIPVACEVDLYGALSEFMCQIASGNPATLLDINNSVPNDLSKGVDTKGAKVEDLFMGFHCGNTASCCMKNCSMKYQLIMNRAIEDPLDEPDITRGTLEGQLMPGPATFFRLQGTADGKLASYICEGNILDVDPHTFGATGIFAIPNFSRFYRHVLIGKNFPHHGAIAFKKCGKALFDAAKLLEVKDISSPLPSGIPYPDENPFE